MRFPGLARPSRSPCSGVATRTFTAVVVPRAEALGAPRSLRAAVRQIRRSEIMRPHCTGVKSIPALPDQGTYALHRIASARIMLTAFDHGRLFGERSGTGEPWVLALHGWRRTHRDFAAALDGLDAVALDLPGFGASPPPPEAWGGAEYAKAIVPVVETMGAPVVVVGHSFGGRVAVHLAAARPDLVRALVLTGVPLLRPADAPKTKPAFTFRMARALNRRHLLSDDRMEQMRQKYGSEDSRQATGVMRSVHVRAVNETYEEQIDAVTCPVELVGGADDTAAPVVVAEQAVDRLQATGNHAVRLTVLPATGHLVPTVAPAELKAAIERLQP